LTFTAKDSLIILIFDITVLKRRFGATPQQSKMQQGTGVADYSSAGHNMVFCLVLFLLGQDSVLPNKWEASESQGSD
jgi:hypothetical protein